MPDQDPVSRLNAALQGRYRIERELGEGGMATVYVADDLRHERKVALKVLKPELAAVVGAERFLAEIKTTANLQHPHILPLFDSGEADSFLFYVMPYVEGESLRQRLDREHQLPVDDAVRIATHVAEALDYAHRHGVIHRDIKPANILIHDGEPVISDFGIALALGAAGAGRLTETGLSLGTPHYMSPEQATGDLSVGPAADIYALGCVLYEMLVGEPPYTGSTPQAVLGKIVTGEADPVTKHRRSVPENVDAAIGKALEKVPADRFASAADFAKALGDAGFRHGMGAAAAGASRSGPWNRLSIVLAGSAAIFAILAAWPLLRSEPAASPGLVTFESPFRAGQGPLDFSVGFDLSPDGSLLVYVGPGADPTDSSGRQLWVRRWSDLDATPIRGTDAASWPAVSPDGEQVAFAQGGEIKVITLSGGPATTLGEGIIPRWGPDGYVYFGALPGGAGPIQRVPAAGGPVEVVRPWADGDSRQVVWDVLPAGDLALTQLIRAGANTSSPDVGLLRIDTGEMTELLPDAATPRFTTTGHIVFEARDSSLMAVPFDPRSEKVGARVRVKENVDGFVGAANRFALSPTGTLVYDPSPSAPTDLSELVWVSRDGSEEPLPIVPARFRYPRVSPDGRRILASLLRDLGGGEDVWTYDVRSGAPLRLTFEGRNSAANWSPDGRRILFSSPKDSPQPATWGNLYSVPADGSGEPEALTTDERNLVITGMSPDGRTLVYSDVVDSTRWEIRSAPSNFRGEPKTLVSGPFHRGGASISPDGRWLAYRSDEARGPYAFDVFVQPFPGPGARVPVSVGGGNHPVWSRDSREIFYQRPDGMLIAASIAGDSIPRVTSRTPLFSTAAYVDLPGTMQYYDVGPDGRFLMMKPYKDDSIDAEAPKMVVVLNWFEELKRMVPN